ncbi:MAG: nucleotide sugar dehydrogenase [Candidatus Bathyarchaeota archaeon]|nr:MAG: nucleotide sugar dehydrogenase [Candidatus Bathyarchaeota archaeon]
MGLMNRSRREIRQLIKNSKITICVVGLGRVGLPTASIFADAGALVLGADINEAIVNQVNGGECPLSDEPKLAKLVRQNVKKGNLKATTNVAKAVAHADVIVVCVPTPVDEHKVPNYSAVKDACKEIAKTLNKGSLVILESTVGPGTVESMVVPLLERQSLLRACRDFGVASCPERADPGRMVENLFSVPRIIGGIDSRSAAVASWLYETAFGVDVVKVSSPKTANAVKLTENLFRDVNIALANEFALLYEKLNIDTVEVIEACATKYNFTPHFPGAGVGGPCLPQNSYYLIVEGIKVGNIPYLVRLAREINDRMPDHVVTLVGEALNEIGKTVKSSKIAVLGVAYKPGVHDLQLTPTRKVVQKLVEMGAKISIYDPMFRNEQVFGTKVADTLEDAVAGVDCVTIVTAHGEFRDLDVRELSRLCSKPAALVDARNTVKPQAAKKNGFAFRGVGRT